MPRAYTCFDMIPDVPEGQVPFMMIEKLLFDGTDPVVPPVDPDPPKPPEPPPADPPPPAARESVRDAVDRHRKPERLQPGSEFSSRRRPHETKH